jgi:hypothetical protein
MILNLEHINRIWMQVILLLSLILPLQRAFSQSITQSQKIFASDRENREHFGYDVQIFEDYAFISAKTEGTRIGHGGSEEGAVYVFKKNIEGTWIEHQKLVGSNRSGDDHFGSALKRSDSLLVIGAAKFGDNDNGAVYIFQLKNDLWIEQVRLEPLEKEENGGFGDDLAIAGEYIVVGAFAYGKNIIGNSSLKEAGVAFIYKQDSKGNWNIHQRLVSPHPQLEGRFGLNVYITEEFLAIGAQNESTNEENKDTLDKAGVVYIYEKDTFGYWEFKEKVVPSDRAKYDSFSGQVVISGNEIFIGAPWKNIGDKKMVGAVYCFEKTEGGNWIEKQKMIPIQSDIQHRASFGYSVAVHEDVLVIGGGIWKNSNGAAYVYVKNDCAIWEYRQKVTAQGEPPTNNSSDFFARWVSISSKNMLFGAIYDHNAPKREDLFESGSAFIFEYEGFEFLDRSCQESQVPPMDGSTFVDSSLNFISDSIPIYFDMDTTFTIEDVSDSLDSVNINTPVTVDTDVTVSDEEDLDENEDDSEEEDKEEISFIVWPYPKEGKIKIEIVGIIEQQYPVTISKPLTGIIKKLILIERETEVDLGRGSKGLYIIKIYTEKGTITKHALLN